MENIELHVVSRSGVAVAHSLYAIFGIAGGTIGRGGQNKLVLRDADTGVARVHAMVRLDADAAYIANLCERRSLRVDGIEVASGQEVRLHVGSNVHIGPYCLRALASGATAAIATSRVPTLAVSAHALHGVVAPSGTFINTVGSAPSRRTEVADQVQGGGISADSLVPYALTPGGSVLGDLLSLGGTSHSSEVVDNPFAMLGRVDSSLSPATPPDSELKINLDSKDIAALSSTALASAATDPRRHANLTSEEPDLAVTIPTLAKANVFDVASMPPATAIAANRPLMIPEDFDPFARDFQGEANARDSWAGLPGKGLSEVANLPTDGLIRSLPLNGPIEDALDNPSHSGLPKALDPKVETDPMQLFGVKSVLDGIERNKAQSVRGSDLAQMFHFPMSGAEIGRNETEHSSNVAENVDLSRSSPEVPFQATSLPSPAIQVHGLFGLPDTSVCERVPALDLSMETMGHADIGAKDYNHFVESMAETQSLNDSLDATIEQTLLPKSVDLAATFHDGHTVSPEVRVLTDAFLSGAGLASGRVEGVLTPELMRQFGEAFRVAVQGTIDLLAARSETKREFRADVTIIASLANNPLKFLPNSDGVIMQMFGEVFPGFMKPVPSMEEAYFDLKVHQLALMAGIRAAYVEALNRLDPDQFEKRAEIGSGIFGKISSIVRKAALWDEYKQSYGTICSNAKDDLEGFSGEAFVKAYDAAADAAKDRP